MSVLKASPALEVPHVEVHNARDWDLVDDISLGLPGGMDSENTTVLFVKGGALRTAVRLATPTLLKNQYCVNGDGSYERSYPASARWTESRRRSCR